MAKSLIAQTQFRRAEERAGGARSEGCAAILQLPPVIGHRGAAARAPENTLAGLRRAKALGCEWVEVDVRLTADGVPVLCHDARLDRTTSGFGAVSACSFAAIRELDAGSCFGPECAGERVPTLDEALGLAAALGLGVNIEFKAEGGREYATAAAVAAMLQRPDIGLPPVLLSSFQRPAVATLHRLVPHLPRGILFRLIPRNWAELAACFECVAIGADHRHLRPGRIAAIRAAGFQLAAFTVNSPARARRLFDWGVTSVFTDVPDIILAQVNAGERPARLPAHPVFARQGAVR